MRIDGTLTLKQPRLNHDHHTQCKIQLSTLTFWYRWVCHEGSGKFKLWLILKICIHFSDRFEASLNQFVVNKLLSLNLLCLPLPESCRSPNGRNGQCTLFNNCAVLFNMYNQQPNNNQVINFLIASQRSCANRNSNRTPIVCCEQAATVQTTPAPTNGGSPCTEPQGRSGVCQSKNRVIFPDKILINIISSKTFATVLRSTMNSWCAATILRSPITCNSRMPVAITRIRTSAVRPVRQLLRLLLRPWLMLLQSL